MKYIMLLLSVILFCGTSYASEQKIPQEIMENIIYQLDVAPFMIMVNTVYYAKIKQFYANQNKKNILSLLEECIHEKNEFSAHVLVIHNTCFDPVNEQDSHDIGTFVNQKIVCANKDTPIETIIAKRYPRAYSDIWRYHQPHWDSDEIRRRLTKGTVLRVNRASNQAPLPIIPMFLFLVEYRRILDNNTTPKQLAEPEYDLIKLLLQLGANPHYRYHDRMKGVDENIFMVIEDSSKKDEQEKLTTLITPFIRTPVNTNDMFYPGTAGYKKSSDT